MILTSVNIMRKLSLLLIIVVVLVAGLISPENVKASRVKRGFTVERVEHNTVVRNTTKKTEVISMVTTSRKGVRLHVNVVIKGRSSVKLYGRRECIAGKAPKSYVVEVARVSKKQQRTFMHGGRLSFGIKATRVVSL